MTVNRWDVEYVESLVARADGDMEALERLLVLLRRVHADGDLEERHAVAGKRRVWLAAQAVDPGERRYRLIRLARVDAQAADGLEPGC